MNGKSLQPISYGFFAGCENCRSGEYLLVGDSVPIEMGKTIAQSDICHICPAHAMKNCSGGLVGASFGYWMKSPTATTVNTVIPDLVACPLHYCCDLIDGCGRTDACSNNRTGVLCGDCKPGFTHALTPNHRCVRAEECSSTRVAISWLGHALIAWGLVAFFTRRAWRRVNLEHRQTESDRRINGALKVLVAWSNAAVLISSGNTFFISVFILF